MERLVKMGSLSGRTGTITVDARGVRFQPNAQALAVAPAPPPPPAKRGPAPKPAPKADTGAAEEVKPRRVPLPKPGEPGQMRFLE